MSNRVKPKLDNRPSVHTCPFCRSWCLEVPAFWEDFREIENEVATHVKECIGGDSVDNVEVTFK